MWRGQNWKSSLPRLDSDHQEGTVTDVDNATSIAPTSEGQEVPASCVPTVLVDNASPGVPDSGTSHVDSKVMNAEESEVSSSIERVDPCLATDADSTVSDIQSPEDDELEATGTTSYTASISDDSGYADVEPAIGSNTSGNENTSDGSDSADGPLMQIVESETPLLTDKNTQTKLDPLEAHGHTDNEKHAASEALQDTKDWARLPAPCTEGVLSLLKQAVEGGSAIVLDDSYLDADIVYQKAVAFAKSAPPGPVFRDRPRRVTFKKSLVENSEKQDTEDSESQANTTKLAAKKGRDRKVSKIQESRDFDERLNNVVPQGCLRVDELAKLLA